MKVTLAILSFWIFVLSCAPGKEEALEYYEEIYKNSAPVRTSQSRFLKDFEQYANSVADSDTILLVSSRLKALRDSNAVVLNNIQRAKTAINNLGPFNGNDQLRDNVFQILNLQLSLHDTIFPAAFEALNDGIIQPEEHLIFNRYSQQYETLREVYHEWKGVRKDFCNSYDIHAEDIEKLQSKYTNE